MPNDAVTTAVRSVRFDKAAQPDEGKRMTSKTWYARDGFRTGFWAAQPAKTTGMHASTDAADSLARKSPRVLMFEVTQIGTVDPDTGLSCTA